ncbi:MAG: uncharacterized protein JWN34_6066 [Bryobacterales bacterium]|nr:uncharacterized protein [Bryobacterales bacterium]
MGNTSIQWTDKTWSPIRARVRTNAAAIARRLKYSSLVQIAEKMAGRVGPHCEMVSPGCQHCYSQSNNGRCLPANGTGLPFDRRSRDLVEPFLDEFILREPLRWREPGKVFVENQSDLFGEWVTDEQLDRVFAVIALCPQHTFQVLTKRPERMLAYFKDIAFRQEMIGIQAESISGLDRCMTGSEVEPVTGCSDDIMPRWALPLPNVWLGVSCEDQATADARIPLLLQTPSALRFVSYEPALGPVDFTRISDLYFDSLFGFNQSKERVDWIIVGGESGTGARPMNVRWVRRTIRDCAEAEVAVFVKQLGKRAGISSCADLDCTHPDCGPEWLSLNDPKGGDMSEWPRDVRVRQFPGDSK